MLKQLKSLFRRRGLQTNVARTKEAATAPMSGPAKTKRASPVDDFVASLKGCGHPDYPLLSKDYSPNSRVPCRDLIPFIANRIAEHDLQSVKKFMSLVVEANPGLGIGSNWIEQSVDEVISTPFQKYVEFESGDGLRELQAYFIVASKAGGGRQFLITEDVPELICQALLCHQPIWKPHVTELITKANAWIEEMAEDIPYWETYPRFNSIFKGCQRTDEKLASTLQHLTPAARLHLFYAIEANGGALQSLTNYQIRSLGIDVEATSWELIALKVVNASHSSNSIASAFSKNDLVGICQNHGLSFKKSWNKKKLGEAIELDGSLAEQIASENNLIVPNYDGYEKLTEVASTAKCHAPGFRLLCFA